MRRGMRLLSVCALALVSIAAMPAGAANTFANPAFQTQWQQGEALTPNFWGPLANAKDGQQEPYKEASGGQRLVQYFDKGRMELTNGTVTNGLLATELIKGQIQVGDSTFQPQPPPAIAMAGDPDNTVPTYVQLTGVGAPLLAPASARAGQVASAAISDTAQLTTINIMGLRPDETAAATVGAFDAPTQHNVPAIFVDYRNKAGLLTIGYAISEPFFALVAVRGAPVSVMVQAFERRVLTYTSKNPDAFKVEMGNIGQHYYKWRYPTGLPLTVPTPGTGTTENPTQAAQRILPGYTVDKVTVLDLGADGGQQALVTLEKGTTLVDRNMIAAILTQQNGAWTLAWRTAADANVIVDIAGFPKNGAHPGFVTASYHLCGANCNDGEHTLIRYDGNGATSVLLNGTDDRGLFTADQNTGAVRLSGPVYKSSDPNCCPSYSYLRRWQWQGTAITPQDFVYQQHGESNAPVLPDWLKGVGPFVTLSLQPLVQVKPDANAIAPLFASNVTIKDLNGQSCTATRADIGAAVAKSIIPNVNIWPASNGIDLMATLSLIVNGGTPVSAQAGACTLGGSGVGGYVANVIVAQSGFLITDLQAVAQVFKAIPDSAIQLPGV
jgi:hypothetical protein